MISRDVTVMSVRFLHVGQGNVIVAFSGYFHIHVYFCLLYWKRECPEQ